MKKGFKRILHIFMTITLVLLVVIISNDMKIEYQEDYNIMLKANDNIDKETKELKEEVSTIKENDSNPETKEIKKAKKEVKKVVKSQKNENSQATQTSPTNESKKNNINYGTFGRIYISNYSAALYDYNVNTKSSTNLQTIVNGIDSAAYYKNHGRLVIADHYSQGFSVLINLKEGNTAYIKFEDGTSIKYRLIKKAEGINAEYDLLDSEGNSFFDMDSDLIMYTCYNDGIMATLWVLS